MRIFFFILGLLLAIPALWADTDWPAAREYYGPFDADGFSLPSDRSVRIEDAPPVFNSLQLLAINKKGFLHRARRQAQTVSSESIKIQEPARIYSPSQTFMALSQADAFLFILYPQTSLSVHPQTNRWSYTLIGDRGLVRISTLSQGVTLQVKPTDPRSPWHGMQLSIAAESDLFIKYDGLIWKTFLIKGRLRQDMDPTKTLESHRHPGLLREWEDQQKQSFANGPLQLELFPGQNLNIFAGEVLRYRIGLPNPDDWQAPILRSSPQLAEKTDPANRMSREAGDLRSVILKYWVGNVPPERKQILKFLQENRWEEAHYLLQILLATTPEGDGDQLLAWQALCLFRLQQTTAAAVLQSQVPADSIYTARLLWEQQRSLLRRQSLPNRLPASPRSAEGINLEELYILASTEQSLGRWRAALDHWELWPSSVPEALRDSYQEWQKHLDSQKPMAWYGSLDLVWADNVLHLPPDEAAPDSFGHRSSWAIRSSHRFTYLLERSEVSLIQLEPYASATLYQHSELSDLQRVELGLALPIEWKLDAGQKTLRFKPFFSRLALGYGGGLDRFGYNLQGSFPQWTWQPELSFAQDQNLDTQPLLVHVLDPLTGEPTAAIDRSVRRNSLQLDLKPQDWPSTLRVMIQLWSYRYDKSRADSRQRFFLEGDYLWNLPYSMALKSKVALTQDNFHLPPNRSPVTTTLFALEAIYQDWIRLRPTLAVEREMRQSLDKSSTWNEWRWILGSQHRW